MSATLSMVHPTAYMTQANHIYTLEELKKQSLQMSTLLGNCNDYYKTLNKEFNTELVDHIKESLKKPLNFDILPEPSLLNKDVFICDWLTRVKSQFDPLTPQKIKEVDLELSKENLQKGRVFTALFPGMPEVEGAKNYLLKTIKVVKDFEDLHQIANLQLDIDKNSLDKVQGYKNAMLAGLVGTVTIATGAITMIWFIKASTIAIIAGVVINTIALLYTTYNYWIHRNDEADGKKELNKFQSAINRSLKIYEKKLKPQIYDGSQAILRQRGDSFSFLFFYTI